MIDPPDSQALNHILSGLGTMALAYVGHQFRLNRRAGQVRDNLVRELTRRVEHLSEQLTILTREVDRDRTETRLVQEGLNRLNLEVVKFLRSAK